VIYDDKPEYTKILMRRAEGHSTKRIADTVGYSPGHITLIMRQLWFKDKLRELIVLAGGDRFEAMQTVELEDNWEKLKTLRDTAKSESVQKDVTIYMIDRAKGKPTQTVITEQKKVVDMKDLTAQLSELDAEAEDLKRKLRQARQSEAITV
jgi:hypothetical protein